jgi:hypothetical protein
MRASPLASGADHRDHGPPTSQPHASRAGDRARRLAMTSSRTLPSAWSFGDVVTALASAAAIVSLFLPWFGVSLGWVGVTASGLKVHGYLWVVLVLNAAELLLIAGSVRSHGLSDRLPAAREAVLAELSLLSLAIVVVAFFAKEGAGVGWRYGAVVALAAAAVGALATLGAALSRRARRVWGAPPRRPRARGWPAPPPAGS